MKKSPEKYIAAILALIICAMALFSCGKTEQETETEAETTEAAQDTASALSVSTDGQTPKRGTDAEADTVIELSASGAAVTGAGASAEGTTVTISAAGSYEIYGEAENAKIIVDTADEETVKIILNGAGIYNSVSSAIEIDSAPKTVNIHVQKDSVNLVSDGDSRSDGDETEAAIWSADDLKFSGSGTLYVTGNEKRGIFSKDDIKITGGVILVASVGEGIRGRDSVEISDGAVTVVSGADGIRSDETEKEGKGYVLISGGTVNVTSDGDGLFSVCDLTISGGTVSVTSGGGSANGAAHQDNGGMGGGMGGGFFGKDGADMQWGSTSSDSTDTTVSTKGIKADGSIVISGGSVSVDASDDSIHANDVTVSGGTLSLSTGDDGVHADASLTVCGGDVTVVKSYEGFEGQTITISGGTSSVTASDDGLNASGSGTPLLLITDGYLFVNATGDGLDSNGDIEMSGGTAIVAGPTDNSNGPLDSGDNNNHIALTGGLLIAYGSSGMVEYPTASVTTQYTLGFTLSASAGDLVYITDSDGAAVAAFAVQKAAQSVCISSPAIESGKSYTVYVGGSCDGDALNGVYSGGTCTGGSESCQLTATSTVTTYGSAGMMSSGGRGGMQEAPGRAGGESPLTGTH